MEREPVRWFADDLEPAQDEARRRVGAFLNADPDDLAFVANATTGVNTVLRSLHFQPGDRILAADHEYNAILNAAAFVAARDGVTLDVAALPFPVDGPEAIIEGVLDAVRPRTCLVVLSAVTSPTAVVMPIVELVRAMTDRGIEVLVDGAHAPGQVPVDIAALEAAGVSYWTGNAHKWLCAPKGSGILWVRRDRQAGIRPLVISHGANAAPDRSQPLPARVRLAGHRRLVRAAQHPGGHRRHGRLGAGWLARDHGPQSRACHRRSRPRLRPPRARARHAGRHDRRHGRHPAAGRPGRQRSPFAARHRPASGGAHGAPPDPGARSDRGRRRGRPVATHPRRAVGCCDSRRSSTTACPTTSCWRRAWRDCCRRAECGRRCAAERSLRLDRLAQVAQGELDQAGEGGQAGWPAQGRRRTRSARRRRPRRRATDASHVLRWPSRCDRPTRPARTSSVGRAGRPRRPR